MKTRSFLWENHGIATVNAGDIETKRGKRTSSQSMAGARFDFDTVLQVALQVRWHECLTHETDEGAGRGESLA